MKRVGIAVCVAMMVTGGAASAAAQSSKPAKAKSTPNAKLAPTKRVAPEKVDAAASHEMLVMAYRDNLVTLTKTLRGVGSVTAPVNVDVARPAIAEMQRIYKELMHHHDAQLEVLAGDSDASSIATSARLDARLGRIGQHLKALDLTINDPTPDPKEVAQRSAEILKECAALSPLRAKATR